jgi:hypothetical protein
MAKIVYEGNEYLPENGVIRVLVNGAEDTNSTMPFTVTNTGSAEGVVTIGFESLPEAVVSGNARKISIITEGVTDEK